MLSEITVHLRVFSVGERKSVFERLLALYFKKYNPCSPTTLPLPLSNHQFLTHFYLVGSTSFFYFQCFSCKLSLRCCRHCHTSLLIIQCFSPSFLDYDSHFCLSSLLLRLVSFLVYMLSSLYSLHSYYFSLSGSVFDTFSNYLLKMHRSFY